MAVCSENNYCTKEMFVPCLTIYPSEWKRRIYLDNFLECMFDPNALEEYNEKTQYAGIYITNLFEQVYFKIFNYTYIIDENVCRVVASFISYLGTNGGSQFFADTERFKQIKNVPVEYVYELAWYYENMRKYGHSHNYRAIEYLLNPAEKHPGIGSIYFSSDAYIPTVADYETIEYVCKWLGTFEGQKYLEKCKTEIELQSKIQNQMRVQNGFDNYNVAYDFKNN